MLKLKVYRRFRLLILRLASFSPLVESLRLLYRVAVKLVVWSLSAVKEVRAVALRRPAVRYDGFPGESDLDVTVVVDFKEGNGVATILARLKSLRRWVPLVGEIWIVDAKRWPTHASQRVLDYLAPLDRCVLFSRGALDTSTKTVSLWQLRRKYRSCAFHLMEVIGLCWGPRALDNRLGALRVEKLKSKLQWYEGRAHSRLSELAYPSWYRDGRGGEDRHLVDLLAVLLQNPPSQPEPLLKVRLNGDLRPPREKVCRLISTELEGFVRQFGENLVSVDYFAIRPYAFRFCLAVVIDENLTLEKRRSIHRSLLEPIARVNQHSPGLTPAFPHVWTESEFQACLKLDPMADLLRSVWCWDVLSNRFSYKASEIRELPREELIHEWGESLELMDSLLRGNDTNFWVDLFLYAHALERVLRSGVLELDDTVFHDLIPSGVRELYAARRMHAIDAVPLFELWQSCQRERRRMWRSFEDLKSRNLRDQPGAEFTVTATQNKIATLL